MLSTPPRSIKCNHSLRLLYIWDMVPRDKMFRQLVTAVLSNFTIPVAHIVDLQIIQHLPNCNYCFDCLLPTYIVYWGTGGQDQENQSASDSVNCAQVSPPSLMSHMTNKFCSFICQRNVVTAANFLFPIPCRK